MVPTYRSGCDHSHRMHASRHKKNPAARERRRIPSTLKAKRYLQAGSPSDADVTVGLVVFMPIPHSCVDASCEWVTVAVQLPGASEARTRDRIARMFPEAQETAPPPEVGVTIAAIAALLRGEPVDLSGSILDESRVPEFHRRVYAIARAIPAGRTLTYGEVAGRLGDPGAARAVGQALGENPFPIVVPCHRVLAAHGKLGGFSAPGGTTTKLKLLRIEGAEAAAQLGLFD